MRIENPNPEPTGTRAQPGSAEPPAAVQAPTPASPQCPTPPARDLTPEIKRLIQELETDEEGGVFRNLCSLARQALVDPEDFRRMLLRCELRASRASEIKAILLCPVVCDDFIQKRRSWKEALAAARDEANEPVARSAALLVRRLFTHGPACLGAAPDSGWLLESDGQGHFRLQTPAGTLEMRRLSFTAPSPSANQSST